MAESTFHKSFAFSMCTWIMLNILALSPYGFTQEKKWEDSSMPGEIYTWYKGNRKMQVQLALDEVALFRDQAARLNTEDIQANMKAQYQDAQVIKSNDFVVYVKLPHQADKTKLNEKLLMFKEQQGFKEGGFVFYRNMTKHASNKMALTGEIIVHFHPDWDEMKVLAFSSGYGLRMVKQFSFAPNAYLFASGPGIESLEVANEIYLSGSVLYAYPNWLKTMSKRAVPDDTLFSDQWHLINTGQGGGTSGEDVNIVTVWDIYRGSISEVISIVDDGLEIGHEDLSGNVLPGFSYDWVGGDTDPSPGPGPGDEHGTAVAGVAAAEGFNALGVTGAAPWAALVGHRLLGAETDASEADALTRNNQTIDIYSNSWGPWDDARLEGPGPLTEAALAQGATEGRQGRGNIYVWAGGNGYDDDNSNYDGYANSRYTISVAASTNYGNRASYSEKGANILVNSPSNGGSLGITTTDRTGSKGYNKQGNYTNSFGGTSSAAPLVSGIIALVLQADPNLAWRDVQQILAATAEKNDPGDSDWTTNGAGFHVNHKYGFGRIDAQAAVTAAESWTNLGPELSTQDTSNPDLPIPDNNPTGVLDTIPIAEDISIEYVEILFSAADHTYWGDLQIELTSPAGTTSILSEPHSIATASGYDNWRFGSVRHLGESSQGTWTLAVKDLLAVDTGTFQSWTLKIFGSVEPCPLGNLDDDCDVDFVDFAVFALAWQADSNDDNWNPACDLSDPNDNIINIKDLDVFTYNWLIGK